MPASIRFGRAGETSLRRTTSLPPATLLTMMCWCRSASFPGATALLTYGDSNLDNPIYLVGTTTNVTQRLSLYDGATVLDGATALSLSRWYHVAMTATGTSGPNWLAYLNGALEITGTSRAVTPTAIEVGNDASASGDPFDGGIAAIKLWNRTLSQAEIIAEMPYALPVNRKGLNSCYPVPNGWDILPSGIAYPRAAKTRWADWSGNGLEWTETGTIDTENGPPIKFAPTPVYRRQGRHPSGVATLVHNTPLAWMTGGIPEMAGGMRG